MEIESMKTFTKRLALVMGVAFVALCCWLAPVYITTVNNWWASSNGFVYLLVNTNYAQAIMTVDTNTQAVGFFTNEITRSFQVVGRKVPTNSTANGTAANIFGALQMVGSDGGHSSAALAPTTSGGVAGGVTLRGGVGGNAQNGTTNVFGGAGAPITLAGGAGGIGQGTGGLATNAITGGNGGAVTITSGNGGIPAVAATNNAGGTGGAITMTSGNGGTPSAGWSRRGGVGGNFSFSAGSGSAGTRTNGGSGGSITGIAGNGGSVGTAPGGGGSGGIITLAAGSGGSAVGGGDPSPGADVAITAGSGGTGATNANGGRIHLVGGAPGAGAVAGEVVIGRDDTGLAQGGLQVGPLVTGTTATLTNLLTITAVLDFPSVVAGAVADLPVAFAGAADGDVVTVAVPIASVTNCTWMAFASNAVVYVRAANGQLVTAQDPNSGTFRIKLEKFR